MKQNKKSKFNLEKFEVAKLTNYKAIHGGDGNDPGTITHTLGAVNSGLRCKDLKDLPPPPPPKFGI